MYHRLIVLAWILSLSFQVSAQQLTLIDQFSTSGGIGLAFDSSTDTLWTYGSDKLRQYTQNGTLVQTINNAPGESADDADLDIVETSFALGAKIIPAGSLLFTNGETEVAEVYALDSSGNLLGALVTEFGNSHVVGSAYSPQRGSLFMVQDSVPVSEFDNLVAEIDPVTGEVLNSFDLDVLGTGFSVFYGDLEVSVYTSELFLVSSSESTLLQMTPTGTVIREWSIADGSAGSLRGSGIALDDKRNEIYVQSVSGTVYRYAAEVGPGNFDLDSDVDGADFIKWQRTSVSSAQLDVWSVNLGGAVSSNGAASIAVPESAAVSLILISCCILSTQRLR